MLTVINTARRIAPAADGTTEYILEPLPLYGLAIHIEASATGANTAPSVVDLLNMVTNIQLMLAGTTIYQSSLTDLAYMSATLLKAPALYIPNGEANNDLAQFTCVLPLGRRIGNPGWGLPATPAGQLRLQLTQDVAVGNYDTLTWTIDAIHDDTAKPTGFLRTTTLQRTAGATGDLDIDLPVGRVLMGIGLFSTTERITEAGARGISRIKLLRDSIDTMYSSADWETLQAIGLAAGTSLYSGQDHRHRENTAGAYAQNALTVGQRQFEGVGYSQGYIDLDPLADQSQGLDLTSCNRAQLRLTMDTAEAARVLPVEWWPTGQGAPIPGLG